MSYSLDLRKKVIDSIDENGHIMTEAAETCSIGRETIYRWLKRTELAPTKVTIRK
jgi:transposase